MSGRCNRAALLPGLFLYGFVEFFLAVFNSIDMYVFGSGMHLLTFLITLLEFGIFFYQFIYFLCRPADRSRLWYLVLLLMLIGYNMAVGLLPDPGFAVPEEIQNMISYGSGFLIACYIPYYFYHAFGLSALRWHTRVGVPLFLLLPYVVFFLVLYPLEGDLELATSYGMLIPGGYALVVLLDISRSIRRRETKVEQSASPDGSNQVFRLYAAVLPWATAALLAYLHVSQWLQILITNAGFLLFSMLNIGLKIRLERQRTLQLEKLYAAELGSGLFELNCAAYGLTSREVEIVLLIRKGMQYKYIAYKLFISLDTVKSHVKNIFRKVEVGDKTELIYKLNQPGGFVAL